jgi:hypothetical protein
MRLRLQGLFIYSPFPKNSQNPPPIHENRDFVSPFIPQYLRVSAWLGESNSGDGKAYGKEIEAEKE